MRYWKTLREQPRPLRFVLGRLLWRSGLCWFVRFRHNGSMLRFHPSSFSNALWVDPGQQRQDEMFFESFVKPDDVIVDVGANIGVLTLAAARLSGERGRVVAIEPHPRTFQYLRSNLALNRVRNVVAHRVAVADSAGKVHMTDKLLDDENQVLSEGGGIEVPACTLDSLISEDARIQLLKVDVEGYEKCVFQGARSTLERSETVYFEAWQRHCERFGYSFKDIWELLSNVGFRIYRSCGRQRVTQVPPSYCPTVCENLIATRDLGKFLRRTRYEFEVGAA